MSVKGSNRYLQLIEKIFFDRYKDGDEEINFEIAKSNYYNYI